MLGIPLGLGLGIPLGLGKGQFSAPKCKFINNKIRPVLKTKLGHYNICILIKICLQRMKQITESN